MSAWRIQIGKEFRALLPTWAVVVAVMLLGSAVGGADVRTLAYGVRLVAVFGYCFGAVAIGAWAVGHEYTHHTLTSWLAQPVTRTRLLVTKAAALVCLMALLGLIAASTIFRDVTRFISMDSLTSQKWFVASIFTMPMLTGLCLAPGLAIWCRSPLAGAVSALAIPAGFALIGEIWGLVRFGPSLGNAWLVDDMMHRVAWTGSALACVVGLAATWHGFRGLQAIDRRDVGWRTTHRAVDSKETVTIRGGLLQRVAQLVAKELRLQTLAFVVAILYGAVASVVTMLREPGSVAVDLTWMLSVVYALFIAVLIGAQVSAEERRMGTIEWQVSVPVGTRAQWLIKVSVAAGLILLLGLALPWSLSLVSGWNRGPFDASSPAAREFVLSVLLMTACSLYISSLCRSGLQALLVTIPAIAGLYVVGVQISRFVAGPAVWWVINRYPQQFWWQHLPQPRAWFFTATVLTSAVVFVVVLLRFGLVNHRLLDHSVARAAVQTAWILLVLVMGIAAVITVNGLYIVMTR